MSAPATNVIEFTVSELSFALRRMVEDNFEHVRVRGEISGFRGAAGSGHCYFTLKDSGACLDAVIWRTTLQRLRFKPQEGLEMVATGKLTTFPGRSRYQIVVDFLEPAGEGALMALLEERRRKLQAEGLFDSARKKPIPYLPRIIGVVTSPTGAVIRDILHRLRDRFPSRVLVWPVKVQGDGAAEEVAAAVRGFNAIAAGGAVPRPDLLIVARGGGSVEDLWAFNEETAVRAVAASAIPVISAVGHETDWTLIDHAADLRAPTPTGAAEMAVPVRAELMAATRELASRHELAQRRLFETRRRDFLGLCRALPSLSDLLALPRQKLDDIGSRLGRGLTGNLERPRRRLEDIGGRLGRSLGTEIAKKRRDFSAVGPRLSAFVLDRANRLRGDRLSAAADRLRQANAAGLQRTRRDFVQLARRLDLDAVTRIVARQRQRSEQAGRLLRSYSYESVLDRGFALVLDPRGMPLRAANQVRTNDLLSVRLAEGELAASVVDGAPPRARRTPKAPQQRATASQGSLF